MRSLWIAALVGFLGGGAEAGSLARFTILFDGVERKVLVHVPDGYLEGVPTPVVLMFHGSTGSGQVAYRSFDIPPVADRRGFLAVFPEGLPKPGGPAESRYWHEDVNIPYVGELLDVIEDMYSVDRARVYGVGFSGGAKMVYRLAADPAVSRRLAAIGTVAGGMIHRESEEDPGVVIDPVVSGGQPLSAFLLQGGRDPKVPIAGGPDDEGQMQISFADKVAIWRDFAGAVMPEAYEVAPAPPQVEVWRWNNPHTGLAVVAVVDPPLAHAWPDWGLMDAFWDFFATVPGR